MFTQEQKFVVVRTQGQGKFPLTRYSLVEILPNGRERSASRKAFEEADFAVNYATNFGAEYDNIDLSRVQ